MKKEIILLIALLLCGCSSKRIAYCTREEKGHQSIISFEAAFDNVEEVVVEEIYQLPYNLYGDSSKLDDFLKTIDDEYEMEDDKLVLRKRLKGEYSLSSTLDDLSRKYFYCSCEIIR